MESKRQTSPEISEHFCLFDSQEYTELGRFLPKSEQIQSFFNCAKFQKDWTNLILDIL